MTADDCETLEVSEPLPGAQWGMRSPRQKGDQA